MKKFIILAFFSLCVAMAMSIQMSQFNRLIRDYFNLRVDSKNVKFTPEERQICLSFAKQFKKEYASDEEKDRACLNLLLNKKRIDEHNEKARNNKRKFMRKVWKYSDLSYEEKEAELTGLTIPSDPDDQATEFPEFETKKSFVLPSSIDYSRKMGEARNQGRCGSCWAFSSDYIVRYAMNKRNVSMDFSPQQLIDCVEKCNGCGSGWPKFALDYVKSNGIASEADYPYVKVAQSACLYNPSKKLGTLDQVVHINTNGSESKLQEIVARFGPVSAAICVENDFFSYSTGVYYNPFCCKTLRHAITIVGYGTDPKEGDYWLVMNSWGKSWGQNGFGKFARGAENMCNIASYAIYAS